MATALGNPAPLGLLAFGMTTAMLMFVELGWAEPDFLAVFFGYAFFYGGLCQVLVAVFEIIKGSSFSFAVFGSYGAFWLAWAVSFQERHRGDSALADAAFPNGEAASFILWGLLSLCFFVVTLRKNVCLIVTFGCLVLTFFLLAANKATGASPVQTAAGAFGFVTALAALYTGVAELVNEEFGRHVLPGLAPLHRPERFPITREGVAQRTSYHAKSNTLLLHFRGLNIRTTEDVRAIQEAVVGAIADAKAPDGKVHAIVDYQDVTIAEPIAAEYWDMVAGIERDHYLSARRFHVTSFGTKTAGPVAPTAAASRAVGAAA